MPIVPNLNGVPISSVTPLFDPHNERSFDRIAGGVPVTEFLAGGSINDILGAFTRAKAYCVANSRRLIIFPEYTYPLTTEELVIDVEDLVVQGYGSKILKENQYTFAFKIAADRTCVRGFEIELDSRIAASYPKYEDAPGNGRCAAIYQSYSDDFIIEDLVITNFNSGIRLRGVDKTYANMNTGGVVRNIITNNCDFGMLASRQDQLDVTNFRSKSVSKVQTAPPHAIYFTERDGGNGVIRVSNIYCDSNDYGNTIHAKRTRLYGSNIYGKDMNRVIGLGNGCSGQLTGIYLENHKETTGGQDQAIGIAQCPGMSVSDVWVSQEDDYGKGIFEIIESPGAKINNVSIFSNNDGTTAESPIICDQSPDVRISGVKYKNSAKVTDDYFLVTAKNGSHGVIVSYPEVTGITKILETKDTSDYCRVDMNLDDIKGQFFTGTGLITRTAGAANIEGVGTAFTTELAAGYYVYNLDYQFMGSVASVTDNDTVVMTLLYSAGTGTITTTTPSPNVVGVGTAFLTQLAVGDFIYSSANVYLGTVQSITNDLNLVLTANAAAAVAGDTFKYNVFDTFAFSNGTGTIVCDTSSKTVTGVGTLFNSQFNLDDDNAGMVYYLFTTGNVFIGQVAEVDSNTVLYLVDNAATTIASTSAFKYNDNGFYYGDASQYRATSGDVLQISGTGSHSTSNLDTTTKAINNIEDSTYTYGIDATGGSSTTYPMLKTTGSGDVHLRLNTTGSGVILMEKPIRLKSHTTTNKPAVTSANYGDMIVISNSSTNNYRVAVCLNNAGTPAWMYMDNLAVVP